MMKTLRYAFALGLSGLVAVPSAMAGMCDQPVKLNRVLEVAESDSATFTVCAQQVLREQMPHALFGFNIQHYYFERDIFAASNRSEYNGVLDALRIFPGALYRYPGGLVSNRFDWEASVGPVGKRPKQKSVQWDAAQPVRFGVDEYLQFVKDVGGQPWYVLNLAGWDDRDMFPELDINEVAASNARLAAHVRERVGPDEKVYYQLGNELDRADWQWSHEKYVKRAGATIDAMQAVDPDARFVAFLREFNWTYKGAEKDRGVSRFEDFIADVLTGLPSVNDFSLHFYYDARNSDKVFQKLPWRLRQFRRAMDQATRVRAGKTPNVWVTEHARGINFGQVKARDARPYTSNLAAAISSADFLIALTQMPEVQGASWHGLNAMPWQVFDPENKLQPNPIYWGFRVLRTVDLPRVLATYSASPSASGYEGGYDVRAAVFANETDTEMGVWAVNRSTQTVRVRLRRADWRNRLITVEHRFMAGAEGKDPDDLSVAPTVQLDAKPEKARFDSGATLMLELPPASVSAFRIATGPATR